MSREILQSILKILAKAVLWRYKPTIVGITGSVGKTSIKEAIYTVLKEKFNVRRSTGNYNNEIGVPLTIFGETSAGKNIFGWLIKFLKVFWQFFWKGDYPKILILEMGADRPGDIKYLIGFAKPGVSVISAIGEIPVHVEFFAGPKAVAREKSELVQNLPVDGFAILNYDDETVREMRDRTKAHILTFGFGEGADIKAANYEYRIGDDGIPLGLVFKVDYEGSTIPVRLNNVFGKQQVYSALGAFGVGIAMK